MNKINELFEQDMFNLGLTINTYEEFTPIGMLEEYNNECTKWFEFVWLLERTLYV